MKLVSWNVNGIRAVHNKGLLKPFFDDLKPDIVCFQETKAHQHQFTKAKKEAKTTQPLFGSVHDGVEEDDEVTIPGYREYWNSAKKSGYAGTALFSKHEPLTVIPDLPEEYVKHFHVKPDAFGDPNAEGRVIAAEFKDFYVVNVYTPNSKPDLSRLELRHRSWDPAIRTYCADLQRKKPVILCGDMNVAHTEDDLANPRANEGEHGFTKEEREGIDKLLGEGFKDSFRHFTKGGGHYSWWSHFARARERNIGWRLDYFFVSSSLISRVTSADIHPGIKGSDHCPVALSLEI